MADAMAWEVGKSYAVFARTTFTTLLFSGEVLKVTKAGRAELKVTRPDGGSFRQTFTKEGREPGRGRVDYVQEWNADTRARFDAKVAERRASKAKQEAEAAADRREAELDREAADYLRELLDGKNDPRADRARALVRRWTG